MQQDKVFFIGLGKGGSIIVNELRKSAYSGIMIDCSTNNMNFLKMQEEKDYYILGETGGTGGLRSNGRKNIEKELWKIQDRLLTVQKVEHLVIVAYADSGVSGGSEVLVRDIKKKYPYCKISIVSIICMKQASKGQIVQMLGMCKENRKLKQEGLLESDIYVSNPANRKNDVIIEAFDEIFNGNGSMNPLSDETLEEIIQATGNQVFRVGKQAEEVGKLLEKQLVEKCSTDIRILAEYGIMHIDKFLKAAQDKQEQREQERQIKEKEQGIRRDKYKELVQDMNELDYFCFTLNLSNAKSEFKGIVEYLDRYLSVLKD